MTMTPALDALVDATAPAITNLGQITGELVAILQAESDAHSDPMTVAYGAGSDMGGLWNRSAVRKAAGVLARHGVTPFRLRGVLSARCDAKWLYDWGILALLSEVAEAHQAAVNASHVAQDRADEARLLGRTQ